MTAEDALEEVPENVPAEIRRGRRLGRYILCYELASGGMATVYLARSPGPSGFEKLVALKLIHPHLAKEKRFVDMFLDEARIAARINHPNVCGVFDFGQADGTYYLAMEYLTGETLARIARGIARCDPTLINHERLPALLAFVIQQACEGLHAAHELRDSDGQLAKLVHRDVTPQNLFLGFDGSVRVVDFGVASATGRVHQTTTGTLKGKFAYMSPEQLNRKELDRRSDIFSLGVCLWELLTRRRLFKRVNEFETLKAVVDSDIPAPSALKPGIPTELDVIALRALERNVDERYSTARELGQDLGRFVASQGGSSPADIAELMATLFPEGRERGRDLIERARAVDPEAISTSRTVPAPGTRASGTMPSGTVLGTSRRNLAAGIGLGALLVVGAVSVVWSRSIAPIGEVASPEPIVAENTAAAVDPAAVDPDEVDPDAVDPDAVDPDAVDPEMTFEIPSEDPPEGIDETGVSDETGGSDDPVDADPEPSRPVPARNRMGMVRPRMTQVTVSPGMAMAAEPVGQGRVNVVTPPGWADIFVDGRNRGRSPVELTLPAGARRVRLVPYGDGEPIVRSVNIVDGATARLVVRLPD